MAHVHRIDKPSKVDLSRYGTSPPDSLNKEGAVKERERLGKRLKELEDLLFYAGQSALLVVLQGMDTSGKDGAARCILDFCDVQSTRVAPFKVPTVEEASHDFLWRVHQAAPALGAITVFNRSHYEDVLVVRVHQLVKDSVWKARFAHINAFERLLADSGTLIVKFFLNISKEEQERRLLAREEDVEKAWKLSVGDWKERELWNKYRAAYEDAIGKCADERAPWHIVPADAKWYRDVAVLQTLVDTLSPFEKDWLRHLESLGGKRKAELKAYRSEKS